MQRKDDVEGQGKFIKKLKLRRRKNISCDSAKVLRKDVNQQRSMKKNHNDKRSQETAAVGHKYFELQTESFLRERLPEVVSTKNALSEDEDEQELSTSMWEKLSSSETNEDFKYRFPINEEEPTSEPFVDFSKYEMTTELSQTDQRLCCVSKEQQSMACSATFNNENPHTDDSGPPGIDLKFDTCENSPIIIQSGELLDNDSLIQTKEHQQNNVSVNSTFMDQSVVFFILNLFMYGITILITFNFIVIVLKQN